MNLVDQEWHPSPTKPDSLRKIKALLRECNGSDQIRRLRETLLESPLNGAIPPEVRGAVWIHLLGIQSEDMFAESASNFALAARSAVTEENLKDQIEKDVERTRPGLKRFKNVAVRGALIRLLSLFCLRKQVQYIQGFNELIAPFILLKDTGSNPRIVYALFSEFLTKFSPWLLDTSESRVFDVLKRAFKYFGRLLLYEDPEMFWLLEKNMMTPDLYATSWFVTLFARNFTIENVIALWDLMLLDDRPLGIVFFGLALLLSKREELLSIDPSRLPEALMMISVVSPDEVRTLWQKAEEMRRHSIPESFYDLMEDRLLHPSAKATPKALSAARSMQAAVCLQVTVSDLHSSKLKAFIWDCRTKEEYDAGHLAQAAFLCLDGVRACYGDSAKVSDAAKAELERAFELCMPFRNSAHICLVGSGFKDEDNSDVNVLALYLTKRNVRFVSSLRGGFRAAIAAVEDSGGGLDKAREVIELVDYDPSGHVAARAARQHSKSLQDRKNRLTRTQELTRSQEPSPTLHSGSGISSFLEKTDAEMSSALGRALSGLGATFASYTGRSSGDRADVSGSGSLQESTSPTLSIADWMSPSNLGSNGTSPSSAKVPPLNIASTGQGQGSFGSQGALRSTSSPREAFAEGLSSSTVSQNGRGNTSFLVSPLNSMSPRDELSPNSRRDRGPQRNGFFGASRSPWGRDARPGWLNDESLELPLKSMPKGFTVNTMDERVMKGLRLFPCRAKNGKHGNKNDFKRRYVGVCSNYFILLSPQGHRSHLLEVKLIRLLGDVVRITFKRSRPELVTFEFLDEDSNNEFIVCMMPEGLQECVDLIKGYLEAKEESGNIASASNITQNLSEEKKESSAPEESAANDKANTKPLCVPPEVAQDRSSMQNSGPITKPIVETGTLLDLEE